MFKSVFLKMIMLVKFDYREIRVHVDQHKTMKTCWYEISEKKKINGEVLRDVQGGRVNGILSRNIK